MFIDPIPDPIAAGWAKEGDQSHASSATSLRINDVNNTGFARFYVQDSSAFTSDIELNPSVLLAEGFTVDAENRTGVHVAINDGAREVRADILQIGAGLRVALRLETGYTPGFALLGSFASFQLKRLADGSGSLAVAGQTPEIVRWLDLAASGRPGAQTIEFGCDNRGGVVSSDWYTLGLSPLPRPTPFASFTVDRLQLRVRT